MLSRFGKLTSLKNTTVREDGARGFLIRSRVAATRCWLGASSCRPNNAPSSRSSSPISCRALARTAAATTRKHDLSTRLAGSRHRRRAAGAIARRDPPRGGQEAGRENKGIGREGNVTHYARLAAA